MFKFRNVTANATDHHLTPIQAGFASDLNVASAVPNTMFLILNTFLGYLIPLRWRMFGSMSVVLLFFGITSALVQVDTDAHQPMFFGFTMLTVVIMNIASAILAGGLFGLAGQFPSEYMTAVIGGQALGGIFAALAEIISLTFGASPTRTALVYFIIGTAVTFLAIQLYALVSRTAYFGYYTSKGQVQCNGTGDDEIRHLVDDAEEDCDGELMVRQVQPNFQAVFRKIWMYGFVEWFVFVVTLSIYPAVTVLIVSEGHGNGRPWNDVYFTTVVNYLTFNTGDYVGRIIAGLVEWPTNRPRLLIFASLLRIVWVPLFMVCNAQPRTSLPVLIHSDTVYILLMICFAVTNGYLANIALISAPKRVQAHEREMASSMMAAFLGVGLAFGSMFSLILVKLL